VFCRWLWFRRFRRSIYAAGDSQVMSIVRCMLTPSLILRITLNHLLPNSNQLYKQQPAAVIAALCEPATHLEGSIAAQCGQLVSELEAAAAAIAGAGDAAAAAAVAEALRPQHLLPRLGLRLARLGYVVHVRCTSSTGAAPAGASSSTGAAAAAGQQQVQPPPADANHPAAADHQHGNQQQQQQQAGRHAFLAVQQPEELTGPVVVDCDFAAQFGLPSADRRYQEAVAALPRVLVMQVRRCGWLAGCDLCGWFAGVFSVDVCHTPGNPTRQSNLPSPPNKTKIATTGVAPLLLDRGPLH